MNAQILAVIYSDAIRHDILSCIFPAFKPVRVTTKN